MAPIYIVSVLFILAIGSTPCLSKECTEENIDSCYFYNDNDCPFSRKQVKCMEEIDTSTCSDEILEQFTSAISQAREEAEDCPGLPDGICIFNALYPCEKDIPYQIVIYRHLTEDQIKKLCQEFKGKEDDARACLKAVRPKCKSNYALSSIDESVKDVDAIEKKCASYQ